MKHCKFSKQIGLIVIFSFIYSTSSYSQNWLFGKNCGIEFNKIGSNNYTISTIPSNTQTGEGCAVVNDKQGNLLFYCDGAKVYKSNGVVMQNGTGLFGDPSSSQATVIIPKPKADTTLCADSFLVFTTPAWGSGNLCYSLVIFNAANPSGTVDASHKNIILANNASEKLTFYYEPFLDCYWILAHKIEINNASNTFGDEYIITRLSVGSLANCLTTTTQKIGSQHQQHYFNAPGTMKISPNGKKLATAYWYASYVDVFDFNSITGVLSNAQHLAYPFDAAKPYEYAAYGLSFSANSNYLFSNC